jgi:hypothetical protein
MHSRRSIDILSQTAVSDLYGPSRQTAQDRKKIAGGLGGEGYDDMEEEVRLTSGNAHQPLGLDGWSVFRLYVKTALNIKALGPWAIPSESFLRTACRDILNNARIGEILRRVCLFTILFGPSTAWVYGGRTIC